MINMYLVIQKQNSPRRDDVALSGAILMQTK
jgi:hypothetical protein